MKAILLLPLLLAFPPATPWQSFAVDQRVAVELPSQPTEVNVAKLAAGKPMGHARLWGLRAPEGIYQVLRLPTGGLISPTDEAARNAYYQGVVSSVRRKEHGQPVAMTAFPTAGGTGMEVEYKGIHKGTGKRVRKVTRCLVLDSVGYPLNFTPTDQQDSLGLAGAKQRRRFYNSLTVKP